jgi:hypothetical protein
MASMENIVENRSVENLPVENGSAKNLPIELNKEAPVKVVRKGKKIVNKMAVPSSRVGGTSYPWAIHVHAMIKEANRELLKNEAVINAYNQFVECLLKHSDNLVTRVPYPAEKYAYGIEVAIHETNLLRSVNSKNNITIRRRYDDFKPEIIHEVYTVYQVLYHLIKDDVVPYMNKTYQEKYKAEKRKEGIKMLEYLTKLESKATEKYNWHKQQYDANISEIQNRICEISNELSKL